MNPRQHSLAGPLLAGSMLALVGVFPAGCSSDEAAQREDPATPLEGAPSDGAPTTDPRPDPHSFARPDQARVKHVSLDLVVDFENSSLAGTATLNVEKQPGVERLILDTRDLHIEDVVDGAGGPLDYAFGDEDKLFGKALNVTLYEDTQVVVVRYRTQPKAAALQWLTPDLTEGKEHPYLFTQGQAILTRTWIPLQDTPAVRITYDAKITVPAPLVAVMSAKHETAPGAASSATSEDGKTRVFKFDMPQAIPPYLVALAVGDLKFKAIGPRTGVWAEAPSVERAAAEFSDVEKMMTSVEAMYGAYRWERYEILVLPPSFPFGGMENPRLTFLSPTVIAGDKSLVSVVAHELAHSWSGNLVTNSTWSDFWLNEGFTTYIENRILEEIYGKDRAKLVESIGRRDLLEEIDELGHDAEGTKLKCSLIGLDPDEAITSTPYDKGMALLRLMENTFGRATFDAFLKRYFDENAFQTMTTARFRARVEAELIKDDKTLADQLQLDVWLHQPGVPPNLPAVDSALLTTIEKAAGSFAGGEALDSVPDKAWGALEWVIFMRALPRTLPANKIAALDGALSASTTGNSEIRFEWLKLVVANEYGAGVPALRAFVTTQGRRRLVEPMFVGLMKTEWGKPIAAEVYAQARPSYHPLTRATIDGIVAKPFAPQGG